MSIYQRGAVFVREISTIIADAKFEFGMLDGEIILFDEVLTSNSSRFRPIVLYEPGHGQPSFEKQFVRDWLETTDVDKISEPADIVEKTEEEYVEAYHILFGEQFA